jgi:hypothetical protein
VKGSVEFFHVEKNISIVVAGGMDATGEYSIEYQHGVLGADVSHLIEGAARVGSRVRRDDALIWHSASSKLRALVGESGVTLPTYLKTLGNLGLLMQFVGKLNHCVGASSRLPADIDDHGISEALLSGEALAPRVVGTPTAVCASSCVGLFLQATPRKQGHVQQLTRCKDCVKLRTAGRLRRNKKRKRGKEMREASDDKDTPADDAKLMERLVAAELLLAQVAKADAALLPANCIPQAAVVRGMVARLRGDRTGKQRRYTKGELAFFTDLERRIGSAAYDQVESSMPMPRLRTVQNYKPTGRSLQNFDFMDLLDVVLPRCDRVALSREVQLSLAQCILRTGIVGFDGVSGRAEFDMDHNLELTGLVEKEIVAWVDLTMDDVASKVATEMLTFIWRSAFCSDVKCTLLTVDSTKATSELIGDQLSLVLKALRAPPSPQRMKQLVSLGGVALTKGEIDSLHTAFVEGSLHLVADAATPHSKPLAEAVAEADNGVEGESTDSTHAAKRIGNRVRDLKGRNVAYVVLPAGEPELEAVISPSTPMPIVPQVPHGASPNSVAKPEVIRFSFDNYAQWTLKQVGGVLSAVRARVSDASPDKWTKMNVPPLLRMLKTERLELFERDAKLRAERACRAAGAGADKEALADAAIAAICAAHEATNTRRVLFCVGESVRALLDRRPLASSQEMLNVLSKEKTTTENIAALVSLLNKCWQKRQLHMTKVTEWLVLTHEMHRTGEAKKREEAFAEANNVKAAKVKRIGNAALASDVQKIIKDHQRVVEQVLHSLTKLKDCSFLELVDFVENLLIISPGRWSTDANEGLHLYIRLRAPNHTPTTRDAHAAAASHHAGQVAAAFASATPTVAAILAPESVSGSRGSRGTTLPDESQAPGPASVVPARKTKRHPRSAQAVVVAPVVSRRAAKAEATRQRTTALPVEVLATVHAQDAAVMAYENTPRSQRGQSFPHSEALDLDGRRTFLYITGAAVSSLGKRFDFDAPSIPDAPDVEAAVAVCRSRTNRDVAEAVVRLVYAMTTVEGGDGDGDHNQLVDLRERTPGRLVRFRYEAASNYLWIMAGRLVYECTPSVKPEGESKRRRVYTSQQQRLQRVVESTLMHDRAFQVGAGLLTPDQAILAHTELVRTVHRKWFKSDVVPALNAEIGAAREERRSRQRKRRRAKAQDATAAAVAAAKNEPAPPKTVKKVKKLSGTLPAPISTANMLMGK